MAGTWQPPDIGPIYDFGIATRDGSSLSCLNKDGKAVLVSKLAFMAAPDLKGAIKEATELQEKERLIQLSSSALIDREFDQWPQITQGDWSSGLGQRVFGTNGLQSAYYDGEGLLWPANDWVPQVGLRGPTQGLPQGGTSAPSGPDAGTQITAPGGSAAVTQAAAILASLKATGLVALIGVKGAFLAGSNTAVAPAFGQATTAAHGLVAAVSGQRQSLGGSVNLGDTGAATFSFDFAGNGSDNVIGTTNTWTVPAGGIYINSISVYMGGHTAPCNAIFVVWNANTGAVIVNCSTFSAGTGRALRTQNVSQTFVAAGTVLRIGFWRQQNQDAEWGVAAAGGFQYSTNVGWVAGQPGTACAGPYVCGNIQAYLTYQALTVSDIVQSNAGGAPGWSKIGQQNSPDGYQQVQIWAKPNSGAGETAPAFAAAAGTSLMHAQLAEFSNLVLTAPTDQTAGATTQNLTTTTVTAPAIDSVTGDLVIMAGRVSLNGAATAGFSDSFNNGITGVHLGDSGASSIAQHSSFDFGFVPSGAATFASFALNGIAGGHIEGLGMGYAVVYLDNQAPAHWRAAFFSGDLYFDLDLGANTGPKQGPLHMQIAAGYLWILFSEFGNANDLTIRMCGCPYGSNTFTQLRNDALTPTTAGTDGYFGLISASYVGGKLYVAVLQADQNAPPGTPTVNRNALYVVDYSGGTGVVPTGIGAADVVFPFVRGFKAIDLGWQGNTLVVSAGDGLNAYIYTLNAPFSTINTAAVIPGIANALLCSVGSALFIVGWTAGQGGINRMNLYTLDGSTLNDIPFPSIAAFLDSVTSPVAFGNYAIWAVGYANPAGPAGQKAVSIYAYDVVNNRLFRAATFTDPSWTGSDVFGHDVVGVYSTTARTQAAGATFQAQLGVTLFSGQLSKAAETAREFYWGVTPLTPTPNFAGLLQMGVDITSGLIDFTAATNKLFRAALARFIDGLAAGQSIPSVMLNLWFNQDPNRLSAAPDVSANTGTPSNPLPSTPDLDVFLNRISRKVVYQVISSGGGFNGAQGWQNAPKITDIIIQAATGWVLDAALDLGPTVKTNSGSIQEYAFQNQSAPGQLSVDHVVAYNFLRQLWRQKGGQHILSLPNGDSYNALIQQMEFSSPKPFAASFRSDQQSTLQSICNLKIREDI